MIETGGTLHRLLSVACAQPLTFHELEARADRRYGVHGWGYGTCTMACINLAAQGLLDVAERGGWGKPSRYVLTRQGKRLLNELDLIHPTVPPVVP